MTYFKMKEYGKALPYLNKAIKLANRRPVMLCILGAIQIKLGKPEEAQKLLEELQTPPLNNDKRYVIAIIKSHQGHGDEAYSILEKLVDEKYGIMIYMNTDKSFFQQGGDPRFEGLLKKMKFK